MSDGLYFLCLFVTGACAIACTWASRRFISSTSEGGAGVLALTIGATAVIGFMASLPFLRTREMPWWPYIAGGYFAICIFILVLIAAKRGQPPAT
jgi:hypothetical protein